jgi:hypothetical protein
MRVTQLLTKSLRDDPPEAETASHRLMLRAGLIHQGRRHIRQPAFGLEVPAKDRKHHP